MKSLKIIPAKWTARALRPWQVAVVAMVVMLAAPVAEGALVGFYPFDGNDPNADASGQGRTLESVSADPAHLPAGGIEGGAYSFSGAQRLIAPIDINIDVIPQLTMGAWVKTANLAPGLRKILGSDDGGWDRTIGLDDRNGPFRYMSFTGTGVSTNTPGPESTNQWTFFAVTYDEPAAKLTLYVDVDALSQEPLVPVENDSAFGFGMQTVSIGSVGPGSAGEGWEGLIDNVFFFDEVLTAQRLTEIRNNGRSAILGTASDDPNLAITSAPNLKNLNKLPAVKTLSFAIKNTGATKALNIARVTITGPDAAYFTVQAPPTSLAAGAAGSLDFQFDSRGQVGPFSAIATIESDDPTNPSIVLDLSAQVSAAQTLLGLYSFDDPANPLKDDSGSGRTLQDGNDAGNANPTYSATGGVSGGAFSFDGNDRLVAPININPSAVPHLAMGAWVKTSSLDPGLRKAIGHDDGAWDRVIGLDTRTTPEGGPLEDGTFRYVAFTGTNNRGPTQGDPVPAPTSTDAWTFLAADYDQAASRVRLYVDLDASTTADALQEITEEAPLGAGAPTTSIGSISPGNANEGWLGEIDNVFFVSGGLDAATMRAVRDGGKNSLLQFGPDPVIVVKAESPFGQLPDRSSRTAQIQVSNGGATQPLALADVRIVGRDAAAFTLGTVPATIAPGATSNIPVTLNPGNREGLVQATLELISNNTGGRRTAVDLSANLPFASLSSALLGFYSFDDAASPFKDDSGHGNDLTSTDADPVYDGAGGFEGGGFVFDGSQHLIAPININPSVQPVLTMGAWVRTDSLDSGLRKVIGSDDGGWDRTIGLDNREPEVLRYTAFPGNGTPIPGTPEPANTEDWTFLAATFDQGSGVATVWVDLDASTTNDAIVSVSRPNSIYGPGFTTTAIGNLRPDNLAEPWIGAIDNVFFFNTVLSTDDLTALRNKGKAALAGGPVTETVQITSVQKNTGGVVINWTSKAGSNYTIEYSETLPGTWASVGTVAGQGTTATFTDSDATRLGRRTGFYRIAVK